jgi:hypothetical protein
MVGSMTEMGARTGPSEVVSATSASGRLRKLTAVFCPRHEYVIAAVATFPILGHRQ